MHGGVRRAVPRGLWRPPADVQLGSGAVSPADLDLLWPGGGGGGGVGVGAGLSASGAKVRILTQQDTEPLTRVGRDVARVAAPLRGWSRCLWCLSHRAPGLESWVGPWGAGWGGGGGAGGVNRPGGWGLFLRGGCESCRGGRGGVGTGALDRTPGP